MRKSLMHIRVRHGLHNHPKECPDSFPVTFIDWANNETVRNVLVSEFPNLWIMVVYEYPGILANKRPEECRSPICSKRGDDRAAYAKLMALPGVKTVRVESGGLVPWVYARWIAKIGYCYAVALLGLDNVRSSPLIDLILNGSEHPEYLVGGLNQLDTSKSHDFVLEPPANEIFRVKMMDVTAADGKTYIAVYVRLLPMLQGATYLVVVGEKPQNGFALHQNTLDYQSVQFALPSR